MDQEIKLELDIVKKAIHNNQVVIMQLGNDFRNSNINHTKSYSEILLLLIENQKLIMLELAELKEKVSQTLQKEK